MGPISGGLRPDPHDPLSDGIRARRFPYANVALIVANFAVWRGVEHGRLQVWQLVQLGKNVEDAFGHVRYLAFYVARGFVASSSRVLTLVFVFLVRIPAWVFLGVWFLYQLVEADFGLMSASANGGGVAFFAHVGGFVFGYVVARIAAGAGSRSLIRPADGRPAEIV